MNKKMMKRSLALGALMAFVITGSAMAADDYTDKVEVKDSTQEYNNLNINTGTFHEADKRVYGIRAINSKITFNGDTKIVSVETQPPAGAIGSMPQNNSGSTALRLDNGTELKVNGALNIESTANHGRFAVGMGIFNKNKSDFYGDVNIVAKNNNLDKYNGNTWDSWQAARSVGVDFETGSVTNFYGKVHIRAEGYSNNQAIYSYQANTVFHNDAVIEAVSTRANGYGDDVRVINLEGDPPDAYNTALEFKGDNTTIYGKGNKVKGVYSSGGPDKIFSKFTGKNVSITTDGDTESIAVLSQYSGKMFASAETDVNITANSSNGNAFGIYANEYAGSGGIVEIFGNTTIKATGLNESIAISSNQKSNVSVGSEGKTISIEGDIVARNSGIINLSGNANFAADKNIFITDATGIINLAGGNMSGVLNIAKDSKVNLTGATFTANDLANSIVGDGKLVLTDSGVLSTTADQIFTKADTVGTDFVGNAITDIANEKVDFVSGTVSLTDKEYNFDFVQSAVDTMQKHNSSKTSVVMTGTLVGGVEDNNITVDEAAGLGDNVALDKVTAEADGNLLVGSTKAEGDTVENINIKDSVANGFNVGSLELAEGSTGVVITNAQEVTLGGSEGGSVITVEKDAEAKVNVVVGTNDVVDGASKTTGTLNIGNALANADTEYTLNGSVIVNNDSTLNTKGNTTITDDIELNGGSVNAVNGKLEANTIVVNEGTNTITGNVSGIFSAQQDTVTNIGTADASATTSFESVNLNGSTICFDPAWDKAAGQHGMVFDKNVDGNVQIARNNYVAIGTSDTTAAKTMFEKTGLKFGEKDITAVLYIAGNQKLEAGKGSISIDGSKAAFGDFGAVTAGSFSAAANSLTMVDGSKINGNNAAALSGVTSATINQDSAKLYIDGAKKGETYHVIAGADAGWADKNIISDNSLLEFKGDIATDNKYDVTASLKKVNDVYGNKVIIANVVDNTLDKHDKSAAADFFNAAVSSKNNASQEAQISALNSAGAMSELAGVAHSTHAVSNILTDAVADHVSLSNDFEHDSDIWAHYVHNKENVKGLSVANFGTDYDAQYNGIVVGGDFYKKDNVVAGAALTYVDGNINGSTLAARTENDAEYYGVSIYGSVTNDDNAVIGDISYLHGKNEITQYNSGFALTGEPESDAFSVGVRVEKSIETEAGKFVPYAGVRYMHVGTGNYTNSIGMSYDADDANLFLLPVGLKYSAEAKVGGMTIRPVAEVGYVWAMGDTDSAQTVSLNGAADGFGYDVTDEGSYFARIGVKAVSDNVTYGLGYEYQKGDSVKANKWMANLNFSF